MSNKYERKALKLAKMQAALNQSRKRHIIIDQDQIEKARAVKKAKIEEEKEAASDIIPALLEAMKEVTPEESFAALLAENDEDMRDAPSSTDAAPRWMRNGKVIEPESKALLTDFNFDPKLLSALKSQMNVETFFPVQAEVMPVIIKTAITSQSGGTANDVCVCAPTGSGKTLAYALPVIHLLSKRVVVRLRALVILPTRDLALQVAQVFETLSHPLGLKVGTAIGQTSFRQDQENLVRKRSGVSPAAMLYNDPLSPLSSSFSSSSSAQYQSAVDILVCTPGRLLDHIQSTPGFTLSHIRFLIIDEADRLLMQHYNDWVNKVLKHINSSQTGTLQYQPATCIEHDLKHETDRQDSNDDDERDHIDGDDSGNDNTHDNDENNDQDAVLELHPSHLSFQVSSFRKRHKQHASQQSSNMHIDSISSGLVIRDDKVYRALTSTNNSGSDQAWLTGGAAGSGGAGDSIPFQKLLFSATLTRNPQQLASLGLRNAIFFTAVQSKDTNVKYSIPAGLEEYMTVGLADEKPLLLIYLLRTLSLHSSSASFPSTSAPASSAIVFTSSVESTHRLYRLLEVFGGFQVAEYSSHLPQKQRSKIIKNFKDNKVQVVICSDAMARGLDIHNVDVVVNYDVPAYIKTYIHRVGRTARANRKGSAYNLLTRKEVFHFKKMLKKAENSHLKKFKVDRYTLEKIVPTYKASLADLKEALEREEAGLVSPYHPLQLEELQEEEKAEMKEAKSPTLDDSDDSDGSSDGSDGSSDNDSHGTSSGDDSEDDTDDSSDYDSDDSGDDSDQSNDDNNVNISDNSGDENADTVDSGDSSGDSSSDSEDSASGNSDSEDE